MELQSFEEFVVYELSPFLSILIKQKIWHNVECQDNNHIYIAELTSLFIMFRSIAGIAVLWCCNLLKFANIYDKRIYI